MASEGGWRFRLVDLVALVVIGLIAAALLLPATRRAREPARRNQCSNKLKQIGIALQNHHDVYRRFPAVSNQHSDVGVASVWWPEPGAGADDGATPSAGYTTDAGTTAATAGYSWIVRILPYMDEAPLYGQISTASDRFKADAFTPFNVGANGARDENRPGTFSVSTMQDGHATHRHFAAVPLDEVTCPSYAGTSTVAPAKDGDGKLVPGSIVPASYGGQAGSDRLGSPPQLAAITNYVALSATHFPCMQYGAEPKLAATTEIPKGAEPPNGMIVPGTGLNMRACSDGASHTMMVAETIEPTMNCWYDGTTAWTTGINPNTVGPFPPTIDVDSATSVFRHWVVPPGGQTALNIGPVPDPKNVYCPALEGYCASPRTISWGPSSNHSGGVVLHAAVDASVHNIATDIDPAVYMALITIAGREQFPVIIDDP